MGIGSDGRYSRTDRVVIDVASVALAMRIDTLKLIRIVLENVYHIPGVPGYA